MGGGVFGKAFFDLITYFFGLEISNFKTPINFVPKKISTGFPNTPINCPKNVYHVSHRNRNDSFFEYQKCQHTESGLDREKILNDIDLCFLKFSVQWWRVWLFLFYFRGSQKCSKIYHNLIYKKLNHQSWTIPNLVKNCNIRYQKYLFEPFEYKLSYLKPIEKNSCLTCSKHFQITRKTRRLHSCIK